MRKANRRGKHFKLKAKMRKKKATRVIVENIALAVERVSQVDKRQMPFKRLKQIYLNKEMEEIAGKSLQKVLLIQKTVRDWLQRKDQNARNSKLDRFVEADLIILPQERKQDSVLLQGTRKRREHVGSSDQIIADAMMT